jgi:hypothetical protein
MVQITNHVILISCTKNIIVQSDYKIKNPIVCFPLHSKSLALSTFVMVCVPVGKTRCQYCTTQDSGLRPRVIWLSLVTCILLYDVLYSLYVCEFLQRVLLYMNLPNY